MGQYYNILIQDENGGYRAYDRTVSGQYTGGAKLMEHSWWENDVLACVCDILTHGAHRVWWVGDYGNKNEDYELDEIVYPRAWGNRCLMEEFNGSEQTYLFDHSKNRYLVNLTKKEYTSRL